MPRFFTKPGFSGHVLLDAAFALALGVTVSARQVPPPANLSLDVDLPGYEAELDRSANALRHRETIPEFRRSLAAIWHVRTSEGTIDVSTVWLRSDLERLEQEPANYDIAAQRITSRLLAMRAAAAELENSLQQPSTADARSRLDKILDRREFSGKRGPSELELLQARISRWIERLLFKLLSRLHLGAQAGNALSWAVIAITFFVLCYWITRNLGGRSGTQQQQPGVDSPSADSREWAREALAAAERGDYREAIHCAYWAAVASFEARGLLKNDRARTPRESLRLLDQHPSEQKLLREFTRLFELIWYGYRPVSATDWSNARTQLENMGCLTPSTAATANY